MEITEVSVLSQTINVTNSGDSTAKYKITAEVSVRDNAAESISNGRVTDNAGMDKANFNAGKWQPLNINYSSNDIGAEEQVSILREVQDFCASVNEKYNNK